MLASSKFYQVRVITWADSYVWRCICSVYQQPVRVVVPQIPDDGYTWRKYGEKDILGFKFPRYNIQSHYLACEPWLFKIEHDYLKHSGITCGQFTDWFVILLLLELLLQPIFFNISKLAQEG